MGSVWLLALLAGCGTPPGEPPRSVVTAVAPVVLAPAVPTSTSAGESGRDRAPVAEHATSAGPAAAPSAAEPGDTTAASDSNDVIGKGLASWYGRRFHGRKTASGERYDMTDFTAAHRTLPFGTRVRVRSVHSGNEVVVRINDRGPFKRTRIIDLSQAAFVALGLHDRGVTQVELLPE